jgi:hypothetical protein
MPKNRQMGRRGFLKALGFGAAAAAGGCVLPEYRKPQLAYVRAPKGEKTLCTVTRDWYFKDNCGHNNPESYLIKSKEKFRRNAKKGFLEGIDDPRTGKSYTFEYTLRGIWHTYHVYHGMVVHPRRRIHFDVKYGNAARGVHIEEGITAYDHNLDGKVDEISVSRNVYRGKDRDPHEKNWGSFNLYRGPVAFNGYLDWAKCHLACSERTIKKDEFGIVEAAKREVAEIERIKVPEGEIGIVDFPEPKPTNDPRIVRLFEVAQGVYDAVDPYVVGKAHDERLRPRKQAFMPDFFPQITEVLGMVPELRGLLRKDFKIYRPNAGSNINIANKK